MLHFEINLEWRKKYFDSFHKLYSWWQKGIIDDGISYIATGYNISLYKYMTDLINTWCTQLSLSKCFDAELYKLCVLSLLYFPTN